MTTEIGQLIGTSAVGVFAFLLALIAWTPTRFSRYGREALFCASAFCFTVVPTRLLLQFGAISSPTARLINGLAAIAFLAIMVQLYELHRLERNQKPSRAVRWLTSRKDLR